MKSLFLIMLLALGFTAFAQKRISYEYDNAGNRKATIVLTRVSLLKDTGTVSQPIVPPVKPDVLEAEVEEKPVFNETLGEQEIKIYPNPTRGELKIDINRLEPGKVSRLFIYNSAGALVLQKEKLSTSNEINLSSRQAGMYVLRIVLGSKTSVWKIVKQ